MLIDLHAHTKAISHCCRADTEKIMKTAKEYGFDGLVISNHYVKNYFTDEAHKEWIEKYIAEWYNSREVGEKYGLRIFCGIEVTVDYDPRVHLLIYGADDEFIRENLFLGSHTQKELYDMCKKQGYALIQAHPFRNGTSVQDIRYLDGVEINCHPLYKTSCADEVIKAAKDNHLALTCGCDYHADTYRAKGGLFIPDSVKTDTDLAGFILNSKTFELQVHEPANGEIYRMTYNR